MQLPLFLYSENKIGKKGVSVTLSSGAWLIDWNCNSTRIAISVDGQEPFEIKNEQKFQFYDPQTVISLEILEPGSSSHITAWAGRIA